MKYRQIVRRARHDDEIITTATHYTDDLRRLDPRALAHFEIEDGSIVTFDIVHLHVTAELLVDILPSGDRYHREHVLNIDAYIVHSETVQLHDIGLGPYWQALS